MAMGRGAAARAWPAQSVVEFALIAPLFFALLLGVLEFGWLLYADHEVTNAAREGARYAAVHGTRSGDVADAAKVKAYLVERLPLPEAESLAVSLAAQPDMQPGSRVTVAVAYAYHPLVGVVLPTPGLTLSASSTMIVHH